MYFKVSLLSIRFMNFKHYSKNKLGPGTKLMTAVHSQSGIREVKIHAPFLKIIIHMQVDYSTHNWPNS